MKRPHTIAIAAISLDGRLRTRESPTPVFASKADKNRLTHARAAAQAVIVGGNSVRKENMRLTVGGALARRRVKNGLEKQPWTCIVTRRCGLSPKARCFGTPARKIVFTSRAAPRRNLCALERIGVEVVVLGQKEVDLTRAFAWLHAQGIRRLQCEGGGGLLYPLLAKGLVDELWLTLCPAIAGAKGVNSLADGTGFPDNHLPRFRLKEIKRKKDELFLRYFRARS
ncbi:MAG: dihydrofolate reductase family protein [Bdellovibrionota bacterium]